jgi:GDP-L-fucose synthase
LAEPKNIRVLITGASGLVGAALKRVGLGRAGYSLSCVEHQRRLTPDAGCHIIQADLRKSEDCHKVCEGINWVFHAAGGVGSAGATPQQAMSNIVDSLVMTSQLLQASWNCNVSKFLLFGSTTGYPESDGIISEEDMFTGPPPDCYFGYGWMRRYGELLSQYVQRSSKTEVVVLRPSAVYGPGDRSNHVIPSLLRKALTRQEPFEVWGDGQQERDFLYVDDMAEGCWRAMERLPGNCPVNLSSGATVTMQSLTHLVLKAAKHAPKQVRFTTDRPTNVVKRAISNRKAQELLEFVPQVSLTEGLQRTAAWMSSEAADG